MAFVESIWHDIVAGSIKCCTRLLVVRSWGIPHTPKPLLGVGVKTAVRDLVGVRPAEAAKRV